MEWADEKQKEAWEQCRRSPVLVMRSARGAALAEPSVAGLAACCWQERWLLSVKHNLHAAASGMMEPVLAPPPCVCRAVRGLSNYMFHEAQVHFY